jgi:uncharacterized protein
MVGGTGMILDDGEITSQDIHPFTPPPPKVSWRSLTQPPSQGLTQSTYEPKPQLSALYMWGPLAFEVWPLNIHEVDHETDTDWAQKEIAGSAIFREWVGENDENLYLRGKIFPYRIGGMSEMELLEASRRKGISQALIRGGQTVGTHLGWYVIEKLVRSHKFLSSEGIGQVIEFEAVFTRVPVPNDPAGDFAKLWGAGYMG